jgi:hypothetical protein
MLFRLTTSHKYRLAQQAVQIESVPFANLVKPQPIVSGGVK